MDGVGIVDESEDVPGRLFHVGLDATVRYTRNPLGAILVATFGQAHRLGLDETVRERPTRSE